MEGWDENSYINNRIANAIANGNRIGRELLCTRLKLCTICGWRFWQGVAGQH